MGLQENITVGIAAGKGPSSRISQAAADWAQAREPAAARSADAERRAHDHDVAVAHNWATRAMAGSQRAPADALPCGHNGVLARHALTSARAVSGDLAQGIGQPLNADDLHLTDP